MGVNIIVAVGKFDKEKGYPIGKDGGIPWKNKEDMKWFTATTTGHPIIMGRKTYESIGHPLPKRTNIVVSTRKDLWQENANIRVCETIEDAITFAKAFDDEIFVIGGASIYNQALEKNLVDKIYINYLDEAVENADTFFPLAEDYGFTTVEHLGPTMVVMVKERGWDNWVDAQYLSLIEDILMQGEEKDTRAGKTKSLFGRMLRFNLKLGLPVLTTKKMYTKGVIHELLWFLKGDTNIKYLVDNDVHIWDDDAYRYYKELFNDERNKQETVGDAICEKDEFLNNVQLGVAKSGFFNRDGSPYTYGDLGPVYGHQWRNWGGVDQIKNVIETLKTNPDDRRILLSAWNVTCVPLMALPPCHYCCQFYTQKLSHQERLDWLYKNDPGYNPNFEGYTEKFLDQNGVPTRKLSCMFHMRSNDVGCGTPFNWASYAILTHIVAHCTNMDVGDLISTIGDAHIYLNHVDGLKEQMRRNPHLYALPTLWLNPKKKNIDDFTFDDIKIEGYKSYPHIKLELNVGL